MLELKLQKALITQGPAYGIQQPVVVVNLTAPEQRVAPWGFADTLMSKVLRLKDSPARPVEGGHPFAQQLALRLLKWSRVIHLKAGLALHAHGKILGARLFGDGQTLGSVAIPYVAPYSSATLKVVRWVFNALELALNRTDTTALADELSHSYQALSDILSQLGPRDTNTRRFIHAALQADIPHAWLHGSLFQYGWGKRQCIFNSSILETTASMGVATARDKHACAALLRQAGLPVPEHALAADLPAAQALAERLGYPVVVKPASLDGGVGVAAGLQSKAQLVQAWDAALKHSDKILIEKHLPGKDFRVIVFDGQMVWAVGRQPAGVTGDGQQTVKQLIDQANQDPRRGYHMGATLRPIVLDQEALGLLQDQGLSPDSAPAVGQFVTLRRAANISSGGTPSLVTEQVHPDNRVLVERAVSLLRLDLAGVDLILPDIGRSWRETGGGIIEINAQPQLVAASQTHLYEQILRTRLPEGGRIPVVLCVGDPSAATIANEAYEALRVQGQAPGLAIGPECWFPDGSRGATARSGHDAVRALLMHRDVGVVLGVISPQDVLSQGLAVDRYDGLVMSGVGTPGNHGRLTSQYLQVLTMLLPHCGQWLLDADGVPENAIRKLGLPEHSHYETVHLGSSIAHQVLQRLEQSLGR